MQLTASADKSLIILRQLFLTIFRNWSWKMTSKPYKYSIRGKHFWNSKLMAKNDNASTNFSPEDSTILNATSPVQLMSFAKDLLIWKPLTKRDFKSKCFHWFFVHYNNFEIFFGIWEHDHLCVCSPVFICSIYIKKCLNI